MCTPGTEVAIGLYGPRISTGASGFMSQMSTCEGPPPITMKMQDFSDADACVPVSRAGNAPGRPSPSMLSPPACRSCRRVSLPDIEDASKPSGTCNMRILPGGSLELQIVIQVGLPVD